MEEEEALHEEEQIYIQQGRQKLQEDFHEQGMVDEELVDQYGSSLGEQVEFFYEESPNLVYQISAGPRNLHGRPTPSLARPADQNSGAGAASRLAMIVCYNRRTKTPRADEHCYKVTTRSMRRKEKKEQHMKAKKTKQEISKSGVSPEQDSHYKTDHPKLFFPKINEEVKKQL
ncbi:hypothetical protein AXG93_2789s1000 [Marchantia polymorpha subsp. ruderalis]|uniref:Uncharacterized protein n=1 Tax=Marchantia polymorpha subsp. ruderalis TaxID=1480154 RepID=A0A176W7Y3_MARPO|nr:hypothetical protein AXG93_2789s1000 [Marchantia polymorpha subsp. ruderalis]